MLNSFNSIQVPHDAEASQRAIFGCHLSSQEGPFYDGSFSCAATLDVNDSRAEACQFRVSMQKAMANHSARYQKQVTFNQESRQRRYKVVWLSFKQSCDTRISCAKQKKFIA